MNIPEDNQSAPNRKSTVELIMYDNCPILIAIIFALLENRSAATAWNVAKAYPSIVIISCIDPSTQAEVKPFNAMKRDCCRWAFLICSSIERRPSMYI